LVDPTSLGIGEGAKLILSVAGFEEELKILEALTAKEKEKGTMAESETGNGAEVKVVEKDGVEV